MKVLPTQLALFSISLLFSAVCQAQAQTQTPPVTAAYPALPSETPDKFIAPTGSFDYVKTIVPIAMRDGVKLNTVIIVPRGAKSAPILLTRTPYNATELASHNESSHMGPILEGYDNATDVIVEGGYIRVIQVAKPELDEGLGAGRQPHLLRFDQQALHAALRDQLIPRQALASH